MSGIKKIPRKVGKWLQDLVHHKTPIRRNRVRTSLTKPELQQRAARCYAMAGWPDDACRMFEDLGDDHHAGPYHEQQGRWEDAAMCYARAEEWQNAARCYLECQKPDDAAKSLLKAHQVLQAAWVWADHAGQFVRAEATLQQFIPQTETDQLSVNLILARCGAVPAHQMQAAQRLHRTIEQLVTLPPDFQRQRLHNWALRVADALNRPDLITSLHAVGVRADLPAAHEQWERWSFDIWGDATGIPDRS